MKDFANTVPETGQHHENQVVFGSLVKPGASQSFPQIFEDSVLFSAGYGAFGPEDWDNFNAEKGLPRDTEY